MHSVLEWNDLRFFLAIYRMRTLAGAGRSLGVEHTTVGRRLAAMERALGATLFVRTPGGLLPTESAATGGWSAYAAKGYVAVRGIPVPITDLTKHDVVAFNDSLSNAPGAQWLEAHGKTANIVLRSGSIPAAWNAALGGLGIVIAPCFLAEREDAMLRLTPEVLCSRDIALVVHPDLARVARVRVVIDFFVERFKRDAGILSGAVGEPRASLGH